MNTAIRDKFKSNSYTDNMLSVLYFRYYLTLEQIKKEPDQQYIIIMQENIDYINNIMKNQKNKEILADKISIIKEKEDAINKIILDNNLKT